MCLNRPPPPPKGGSYRKDDYPQVTLIVAPAALLDQWKDEIYTHSKPNEFRVFIHHGENKIKTMRDLREMDVVICTYQAIMHSFPAAPKSVKKMKRDEREDYVSKMWDTRGIFHRIKFWR